MLLLPSIVVAARSVTGYAPRMGAPSRATNRRRFTNARRSGPGAIAKASKWCVVRSACTQRGAVSSVFCSAPQREQEALEIRKMPLLTQVLPFDKACVSLSIVCYEEEDLRVWRHGSVTEDGRAMFIFDGLNQLLSAGVEVCIDATNMRLYTVSVARSSFFEW